MKPNSKIMNLPKWLISVTYIKFTQKFLFQETLDENFLNSNSNEFFKNLLSLLSGELKYLLLAINKVEIATKIPKKPRINIGEFGKSYTGIFIVIRNEF